MIKFVPGLPRASHLISLSRSASAASGPSNASRWKNSIIILLKFYSFLLLLILVSILALGFRHKMQRITSFSYNSSLPPSMGPSFIASTSAFVLSAVTGIPIQLLTWREHTKGSRPQKKQNFTK